MIRKFWLRVTKFLGSATLALWLLVFIGVWSIAATAVPQTASSAPAVTAWARTHAALEPLVRAVGLHAAFTSPLFIICVVLLALSTAVCSWSRTKFALHRSRQLAKAASLDSASIVKQHDIEIVIAPEHRQDALAIASETLADLGIKTQARDKVLTSVSPRWSAWGSAVFHWSLLLLIVAALGGALVRAEGTMDIPVGATKPDAPASYEAVTTGPLHSWARVHRSLRVDAFEPNLVLDGIDRGAVPTVSVLDGNGKVVVKQRVYPNQKLHAGSLSSNAPGCGLTVKFAVLDDNGAEVARSLQLVAFSQTATGGTVPLSALTSRDPQGNVQMRLAVSVPLDRADGHYGEWIPVQPKARVVLTNSANMVLLDKVVNQGQTTALPGGGTFKLEGIGWYARLALVDDPSIPLIYASMIIAALGLTMSVVSRQQLLVASVTDTEEGTQLVMQLRLWRNVPAERDEIVGQLATALGDNDKGSNL